jgi:hypothetical protein
VAARHTSPKVLARPTSLNPRATSIRRRARPLGSPAKRPTTRAGHGGRAARQPEGMARPTSLDNATNRPHRPDSEHTLGTARSDHTTLPPEHIGPTARRPGNRSTRGLTHPHIRPAAPDDTPSGAHPMRRPTARQAESIGAPNLAQPPTHEPPRSDSEPTPAPREARHTTLPSRAQQSDRAPAQKQKHAWPHPSTHPTSRTRRHAQRRAPNASPNGSPGRKHWRAQPRSTRPRAWARPLKSRLGALARGASSLVRPGGLPRPGPGARRPNRLGGRRARGVLPPSRCGSRRPGGGLPRRSRAWSPP